MAADFKRRVCSRIQCPHNDDRNGCKLFAVAPHCPIAKEAGVDPMLSQYWLFSEAPLENEDQLLDKVLATESSKNRLRAVESFGE